MSLKAFMPNRNAAATAPKETPSSIDQKSMAEEIAAARGVIDLLKQSLINPARQMELMTALRAFETSYPSRK